MFGFLIPVAKFALKAVIGEVLNSEKFFGAGKGEDKLDQTLTNVNAILGGKFDLTKVVLAADEVVDLVESVVAIGNALGVLDDKPGLDVDYDKLVPALKDLFTALAELSDALA